MDFNLKLFKSLLEGDRKVIYKKETASTNTDLIEDVRIGVADTGDVIIADGQTAGRGRRGKSFISPQGGIYFSFCANNIEYGLSTVMCGVAVAVTLEKAGLKPQIKWVNDIFLDGKKVCGILAQAVGDGKRAVIGVGINVSEESIPDKLKEIATALDAHTKNDIQREKLIADIIKTYEMLSNVNLIEGSVKIIREYESRMMLIGREITLSETGEHLTATGIAPDGALMAKRKNGEAVILSSGEVSVRQAD